MPSLRRRYASATLLVLVMICSSCATAGNDIRLSPAAAARVSVLSFTPPPDSEFDPYEGDEQYVDGSIYGRIYPYRQSNGNDGLKNGKYLARIHVDKDYPAGGFKKGWNYWMLADTTGNANPSEKDFVSVVFAAGSTSFRVRPLSVRLDPNHTHGHAQARWRNQSAAMAWATCGPHMCCCEGSTCDARALQ